MWNRQARHQNRQGGEACWDFARNCNPDWGQECRFSQLHMSDQTYWEETKHGTHCGQDWYAGSQGQHGQFWGRASALLGFDDDIHRVCNNNCDQAQYNILQLFDPVVKYSSCRNFEWQVCAAQGKLRGQDGDNILFATAPKHMNLNTYPPFGCCHGMHRRCGAALRCDRAPHA